MNQPLRLLIIEDSEDDVALLLHVLRSGGNEVRYQRVDTAAAMRSAIKSQTWDVITSDYSMPQFNATEALALAKELCPEVPFMIVSGEVDLNLAVSLLRSGAKDYIQKREWARLMPAIERELREVEVRRERQQAEAALRTSEANLAEAQHIAHLGSWEWDMVLNTVRWSKEMFTVFDLDPDHYDGKPEAVLKALHPEDVERFTQSMRINVATGESTSLEYRVIHQDGSIHTLFANGKVEFNQAGIPVRSAGTVQDITEQKLAEVDLRKREAHIKVIFETLAEGVALNEIVFNDDGEMIDYKIIEVNDAFYKIADFHKDVPVIGGLATQLYGMDRDTIKYFWEHHQNAIETAHTDFTSPINQRIYEISTSPFLNNRFVTSFHDITERQQAEVALRESRAILQAAMDNSPAGIAIADAPDGKLRYVNHAGLRIRGGDRQSIVDGVGIDQYVASWQLLDLDGRPLQPDEVPLARAILFGETNHREFIVRRASDDKRIVLGNAAPILDETGKVAAAIVVFTDITERKQAEEQVRRLNAELEKRVAERTAQLMAANTELEAFSYSVSHDLRAPLRSMAGYSAALLEDYAGQLDEQGQHYLARIQAGSKHMGQLINDLLNLSRVTTFANFTSETVDLSALAHSIAAELNDQFPQRRVDWRIAAPLMAQGDRNYLKIVMGNLLNNAFKFTGQREQAKIEVGLLKQAGQPVYFVRDNGTGFDMQYANRLFGPFQRLHSENEFPGSGIGLATVQRIIRRHGGRVWAEAKVDEGATFYFTLD